MLKPMHPDESKKLREALHALKEKLGKDHGEAIKHRMNSMHPVAAILETEEVTPLKVKNHEMEMPNDEEPSREAEDAHDLHKSREGHTDHYSKGGEVRPMPKPEEPKSRDVPLPERERKLPPDAPLGHKKDRTPEMSDGYSSGGTVESDHDSTIEAHKKLLQRLLDDY